MRHRLLQIVVGALVLVPVLLIATSAQAAPMEAKKAPTVKEDVVWQLSKARVVNEGKTVTTPQGTLITGYVVEATAKGKKGTLIPDGKFQMTLSLFSPKKDMPGQKAGQWYVRGDWTITDKNASGKAAKARHSSASVNGTLAAQLPSNPLTGKGDIAALVRVPRTPLVGGGWLAGEGNFSGNGKFEGQIALKTERLPAKSKAGGK